ncbi:hypothetical protein [Megasphaera cerevisiae]|jgi:hypothetical protein|uniref:hypothetical protein n=1 Tax=Megasphaera cerevisiae TaxID=39029 RepID=UPI0009451A0D|nr:hypothetical protein [Megasphaera cerevisiae]MCI1749987.1 hypothetical protein [Megasphaera cerevisiae]OKY54872.1 hypothetical protein BSR42_00795 [Megasphaera cerevisiae]
MKFFRFILPYILISPAAIAVFFIVLFVCCVSVEFAMHIMLYVLGSLTFVTQTSQNIFVSVTSAGPSLIAAALFMNKAVYEMKHIQLKNER